MLQFLFGGKNYVGPMHEVLTPREGQERCRILDLGTGGGFWCVVSENCKYIPLAEQDDRAIDLADEFPEAEVVGVDLAPIQPRYQIPIALLPFPELTCLFSARYQRTARASCQMIQAVAA